MKKHYLLFSVILFLSSCHKDDLPPKNPAASCQILQMKNLEFHEEFIADFTYDKQGNPLRISPTIQQPGIPAYLFRHDNKNRITDVIQYAEGSAGYGESFQDWHRLKYDAKNRVISDSIYHDGRIGHVPVDFNTTYRKPEESFFTYDAQNRMLRSFDRGHWETKFIYTSQGNLDSLLQKSFIYPPHTINTTHFVGYDNKVNFRRTHPIWQFLDRNYSVNNHFNTTAYNKYNLPTKLSMFDPLYRNRFLALYISILEMTYSCK